MEFRLTFTIFDANVTEKDDAKAFYIICVGKWARMEFRLKFTIFDANVTEKDDAKATYRSSFSRSLIRGCLNSLYNPLFLHNMCGEIG